MRFAMIIRCYAHWIRCVAIATWIIAITSACANECLEQKVTHREPADGSVEAEATGTPCARNRDCEGSPEAKRLQNFRYPWEYYCLKDRCRAHCNQNCTGSGFFYPDDGSCYEGSVCGPDRGCTFWPIPCRNVQDCPSVHPPKSGCGGE